MTLGDLVTRWQRLRLHCFRCAHTWRLETGELRDDWALEVTEARPPCPRCRQPDEVLTLPARGEPWQPVGDPNAELVAGFFHAMRSAAKKARRRYR